MVLNSLNFCLSEKLLISPSVFKEILSKYRNLGCRFFLFNTLNISRHSFLACRVSAQRSAVKCMGFLLYVTCCFSLAAFNILSLCSVFVSLISMCLSMFLLEFNLYGTLCSFWTWLFPFPCWGNFQLSSLKIFSHTLSFSLLLLVVGCVWYCLRCLWDCPQFFSFFLLYSALQKVFPLFYLPAHFFIPLLQTFCSRFLLEYL